jgi:crotonobetainyl-CoA:carnitine CoA-transferase CaiB-like acyl-CoA transferase
MTDSNAGLAGLKVVDLGVGMAAALIAKFLREAGAEVTRIEPGGGDPFYEVYPAYAVWRRGCTIERESAEFTPAT